MIVVAAFHRVTINGHCVQCTTHISAQQCNGTFFADGKLWVMEKTIENHEDDKSSAITLNKNPQTA